MHFTTLPLLFSFLPATLAQGYGNYGGSGSTSTSSAAAGSTSSTATPSNVHVVQVGNGGLTFSPNSFNAAIGDTVEFQFYPATHSVAQSNFENPCSPRNGTGVTSFYSGPVTTKSGSNANVFSLMINDTSTIWVYCAVPTHCESGMSAVINPPSDGSKTLDMYQTAAKAVSGTVAPPTVEGGVLGPAMNSSTSSSTSTGTSTSSASTPSSTTKSAGVEANGGVNWFVVALTGALAIGVGSLIV